MGKTRRNATKDGSDIVKEVSSKSKRAGIIQKQTCRSASHQIDDKQGATFPQNLLDLKQGPFAMIGQSSVGVETICPGAVFLIRDFFSAKECKAWVNYADREGFERVSHPASRYMANRECGRIQRDDWAMAQRLHRRMQHIAEYCHSQVPGGFTAPSTCTRPRKQANNQPLKDTTCTRATATSSVSYAPVCCNGNLRLYKYDKGMSFGKHIDESNDIDRYEAGRTEITVLIYLTTCRGGATRFFPPTKKNSHKKEGVAVAPQAGTLLFHVHGDRCLEHCADEVEDGVKYILRTDIVYGMK
jgi:hypothetical protein